MKFLITGSGGFIGGQVSEFLARDGHDIIAIYRKSMPPQHEYRAKVMAVKADLVNGLDEVGKADIIIHAAALTHLVLDSTAADYLNSNGIGMLRLVDYAKRVQPKLTIYFSTLSVHGEAETEELTENTPLYAPGLYGATKYMGELMFEEAGLPAITLRLPGVVGAGHFSPWIGRVLTQALANEPIQIYNSASLFNNIVDTTELHRFVIHSINHGFGGFGLYNLAASDPMRLREVVDLILSLSGSSSKIIEHESTKHSFSISTEKIEQELGYKPTATEDMVRRYVIHNLQSRAHLSGEMSSIR